MKISENIIMDMVVPHIVDNAITYDKFEELFDMLSCSEQNSVAAFLSDHNITLQDADDNLAHAFVTEFTDDTENPFCDESTSVKDSADAFRLQKRNVCLKNELLVKMAREGDAEALNTICVQNQKLVMKYANRYIGVYGNKLSIEDLISAGNIGLMKAVERFDDNLGYAFSTYAVWWIRQAIFREIANNGYTIRIPVHMQERIHKIRRMEGELISKGFTEPECIMEIAKTLGSSEDQILECMLSCQQIMKGSSLDEPMDEDSDEVRMNFVRSDQKNEPENLAGRMFMKADMMNVLHTLNAREEQIIIRRYGLDGTGEHTLEEIGREMGVTRERVRQIETKAMLKLRHPSRSNKLKDYLNGIA